MTNEVALTDQSHQRAKAHLLSDYDHGIQQEHLCFALWYPSHGSERFTAIVNEILLPRPQEVRLHGNASFEGKYLTRAVREAKRKKAGLAMMHSHPGPGWQDLSQTDIRAERDVVAYQAQATKKPFVGMTIGTDGYWSARFWARTATRMDLTWCTKVRVPRRTRYQIDWKPSNHNRARARSRPMLTRTIDTWGIGAQQAIEQLRVGIVGLGSVGSIVAETMARIGISQITLIDPDKIETHNLDRFIYGTEKSVGELKVARVKREMALHSTNKELNVRAISDGIESTESYKCALDCDLLFSCVDSPRRPRRSQLPCNRKCYPGDRRRRGRRAASHRSFIRVREMAEPHSDPWECMPEMYRPIFVVRRCGRARWLIGRPFLYPESP